MESTTLRQFLESICYNSPWKYALFWKLQEYDQMLLTLEDCYCQTPQQRNSIGGIYKNLSYDGSHRISSLEGEFRHNDAYMGQDPVELALAYNFSTQYTLEDSIIGEVTCSGNYCWASADDLSCAALSSKSKIPDDWIYQFAAGIKTIILVPVVPHGVLQLGSLETVAEDQAVVANVSDQFIAFQELVGKFGSFSENLHCSTYSASPRMCTLVENVSADITMDGLKSDQFNEMFSINQPWHMFSTTNQITQLNDAENFEARYVEDELKVSTSSITNDAKVLPICSTEELDGPIPFSQSLSCNTTEMESRFMSPFIQKQAHPFSHPNNDNVGAVTEFAKNINSSFDKGATSQSPADKNANNLATTFSFPEDCELHKALGSRIMGSHGKFLRDTPLSSVQDNKCSSLMSSGNFTSDPEPTVWDNNNSELMLEYLLAGVDFSLDKNMCDSVSNIKSSSTTLQSASSKQQCQFERHSSVVNDAEPQSWVTSIVIDRVRKDNGSSSPSASSIQSVLTALTGEENQKKGHHHTHPRKGSKLSNESKRRFRAADNQKARPRDRQLIQDRLKELRNLVPDGVKCSIDGLLEKTIKHMRFLRSVTDQADKLRQLVHQEAAQGKNWKSGNRKDGQQNGTSWAYDLGSEQQLCPIIVEDLEIPGNMLIEMVCRDHENFLDIAEVIRRLDLTILKGGMENHLESTWARFIVEVPRGFHRLDIFWPLMQLLQ